MKKFISALMIFALFFSLFACKNDDNSVSDSPTVRIAALKGPTAIGLLELMDRNDSGKSENKYTFTVAGSADEITPKMIKGELDIAAIPANLASVLYNKTNGNIMVLAINTLGVTYIVSKNDDIKSLSDLKGKTVYATGKGSTPEYGLRYIFENSGIDIEKDLNVEWKTEPAEIVALLSKAESGVAVLPMPYVFSAKSAIPELSIDLSVSDEWDRISLSKDETDGNFIISVLAVRKDFALSNPDIIKNFISDAERSAGNAKNIEETAVLSEKYGFFNSSVAEKAIPYCNIVFIKGNECKSSLEKFLNVIYKMNPSAVGGEKPESDFYYEE